MGAISIQNSRKNDKRCCGCPTPRRMMSAPWNSGATPDKDTFKGEEAGAHDTNPTHRSAGLHLQEVGEKLITTVCSTKPHFNSTN